MLKCRLGFEKADAVGIFGEGWGERWEDCPAVRESGVVSSGLLLV